MRAHCPNPRVFHRGIRGGRQVHGNQPNRGPPPQQLHVLRLGAVEAGRTRNAACEAVEVVERCVQTNHGLVYVIDGVNADVERTKDVFYGNVNFVEPRQQFNGRVSGGFDPDEPPNVPWVHGVVLREWDLEEQLRAYLTMQVIGQTRDMVCVVGLTRKANAWLVQKGVKDECLKLRLVTDIIPPLMALVPLERKLVSQLDNPNWTMSHRAANNLAAGVAVSQDWTASLRNFVNPVGANADSVRLGALSLLTAGLGGATLKLSGDYKVAGLFGAVSGVCAGLSYLARPHASSLGGR